MGGATRAKQILSIGLGVLLVFTTGPGAATGMAYQSSGTAPAGSTASSYPGQGVPATAEELQSLVAPIALYPDALVAQILTAATFPDQVAIASYWVEQNKSLTGSALTTAVDKQTWDPSVKALTLFPSESREGFPRSPVGPLVAFATEEGLTIKPGAAQPFYGYFFRRLDSQGSAAKGGAKEYVVNGKATGGFGYIAYPAKYDDTGVQTFIINQDSVTYAKNLGKDTVNLAKAITEFNPDNTWAALQ